MTVDIVDALGFEHRLVIVDPKFLSRPITQKEIEANLHGYQNLMHSLPESQRQSYFMPLLHSIVSSGGEGSWNGFSWRSA